MAIRLRRVEGVLVALCAARSIEKPGDYYLDDEQDHALRQKFERDCNEEGICTTLPHKNAIVEREESNNPNRKAWDKLYALSKEATSMTPLPCPFCGAEATITNLRMSNHSFKIGCYNPTCWKPATGWYQTELEVISAWNKRYA